MKFTQKLSVTILVLLAVMFSLGGTLLVRGMFQNALSALVQQNTGAHLLECYALEAELRHIASRGELVTDYRVKNYGEVYSSYLGASNRAVALYGEADDVLFSSIPQALLTQALHTELRDNADSCVLRKEADKYYLLMATSVTTPERQILVMSAFDVTSLFVQRRENVLYLLQLEGILLLCAAALIWLLARLLTKPILHLANAAQRIASGSYAERVTVQSADEIGALGEHFNTMAAAVEGKIAELETQNRQKDDFVLALSHEIKTPMTTIVGYADLLRTTEYAPHVRQKALNAMYNEGKRLETLSQKLLQLMRMADEPPKLEAVALRDIFRTTSQAAVLQNQGVRVEFAAAHGIVVLAEADLISNLLQNLILNAMRAEPKDGCVRVTVQTGADSCCVSVVDTGCGIPKEELARVVEPFYMVDKSRTRRQGGSGIGLSLAQQIAMLHGSRLSIESKLGAGTRVSFVLPLAEEGSHETAQ